MTVGCYDSLTNICEIVSLKWIETANIQSVLNALTNATSITIYLEKKMTREMNKPDWHREWTHKDEKPKERKVDDWIKPFFENCCRMEKLK
jgi:hypothetical protein